MGSCTVHHHNLQLLAIEMYKIHNNLSPEFRPKTVSYGTESMQYLGSKILSLIPMEIKLATLMVLIFARIILAHGKLFFFSCINFRASWKSLFFARIKFRASLNFYLFIFSFIYFRIFTERKLDRSLDV